MSVIPADARLSQGDPAPGQAHMEQLIRLLLDQQETCQQIASCAEEQSSALRMGRGSDFVRASLTQAHLARRLFFLEEERTAAIEALARALSEKSPASDLSTLMERLPEADAERLAARSRDLQRSVEKATAMQRVNAQLVQTNIQLAAALTRNVLDPSAHYYGNQPNAEALPASQLDQRI